MPVLVRKTVSPRRRMRAGVGQSAKKETEECSDVAGTCTAMGIGEVARRTAMMMGSRGRDDASRQAVSMLPSAISVSRRGIRTPDRLLTYTDETETIHIDQ